MQTVTPAGIPILLRNTASGDSEDSKKRNE